MSKIILVVCMDAEYIASIEAALCKEISNKYKLQFITDDTFLDGYVEIPHV